MYLCEKQIHVYLFLQQVNGDANVPNDVDSKVNAVNQGVGELNFEEDEEEQFCMKDLPKHACS